MNKQEAWNILAQATSMVNANREVHDKIKEALVALKPEEEKKEE